MNKKLIISGFLILTVCVVGKLLFSALKHLPVDDFHPAAVIFAIDSSASNQKNLPAQIKYVKQLCTVLDPEDAVKILKVSEKSYLIFEGSASNSKGISKSLEEFTKFESKDYGTAYGEALQKAFSHALTMYKDGYIPAVIIAGDLENEGSIEKQIDWETLPQSVKNLKDEIPDIAMIFLFAHPEKLDLVKTKLSPVLGEKKLVIATDTTGSATLRKILEAIGR